MIKFSVTKNGQPFTDYTWDEETGTFSTTASGLVLDFSGVGGITFNTESYCTFKTGYRSVVIRRDVFEVIHIPEGKTIRLNGINTPGYQLPIT